MANASHPTDFKKTIIPTFLLVLVILFSITETSLDTKAQGYQFLQIIQQYFSPVMLGFIIFFLLIMGLFLGVPRKNKVWITVIVNLVVASFFSYTVFTVAPTLELNIWLGFLVISGTSLIFAYLPQNDK